MTFLQILILISGISFVYYGLSSFFFKKNESRIQQVGLSEQRLIIGSLQLLGGLGLFLGFVFEPLIPLSSASLMLLMLAAIGVRIKIEDQPLRMIPALL